MAEPPPKRFRSENYPSPRAGRDEGRREDNRRFDRRNRSRSRERRDGRDGRDNRDGRDMRDRRRERSGERVLSDIEIELPSEASPMSKEVIAG